MKIPVSPPDLTTIYSSITNSEKFFELLNEGNPVDKKGRYLHWDKLRHLTPPDGLTVDEWWFSTKVSRNNLYRKLPLFSKQNKPFKFVVPDKILRELHWLDRYAAGNIQSSDAITNTQTRNTQTPEHEIPKHPNTKHLNTQTRNT